MEAQCRGLTLNRDRSLEFESRDSASKRTGSSFVIGHLIFQDKLCLCPEMGWKNVACT